MGIDFRNPRISGIIAILSATVLLFTGRLFDVQILQNDYFLERSTKRNAYTVAIPAVRGEIVDRNGNPLVTNRQGNAIILDAAYFPSSNDNHLRNPIILNLLNLFDANGEDWVNNLPLELDSAGNVVFSEDSDTEIETMKSKDNLYLASYATAQDCFDRLVEKYELQDYSVSDALRVGAIRYELTLQSFSISNPVTIAQDVSDETVQIIKESADTYLGADVQITAYREYVDGTLAPHIIGVTGKITAEEYQELKDQGYGMDDIIGQSGIEKAMEDYLRGESGEMTVTIEDDGSVTKEVTKQPKQGGTVVLTIDRDLQREAQDALADVVAEVAEDAGEPSAGAVVVQHVNTGEILAAASYPTYDLSTYREDYDTLAANSQLPLFSRFAQGTYAPGSTFKPAMAIAALESGTVDSTTTFRCTGTYKYLDQTFSCLSAHGSLDVVRAIQHSCNTYFYNVADAMGIELMNEYAADFGLGQRTGVEIPEALGVLASPSYKESLGSVWNPGDTIQAAIGQSDHLFTPLQLASYSATLANGGTRYQSRLVKQVMSYDYSEIVAQYQPTVLDEVEISPTSLDLVKEGMNRVGTVGTLSSAFRGLNFEVSAKTGTSQVRGSDGQIRNNGFLISFAPSDDPELSIASVIELAGSGTSTADLTRRILDYYYTETTSDSIPQDYGTLLS